MNPSLGEIYQLLCHSIKTTTNIKFEIVNILIKLLGMVGDLDVRIPINEGFVRYIEEEE
jgi:hypothetical protein